jgi:hypothetical protein
VRDRRNQNPYKNKNKEPNDAHAELMPQFNGWILSKRDKGPENG